MSGCHSPRKRASRTTSENMWPQKQTPEAEVPLCTQEKWAKATVERRVRVQVLSAATVHHWLECHMRNWKENLRGVGIDRWRQHQKEPNRMKCCHLQQARIDLEMIVLSEKKSDRGRQII